MIIFFVIIVLLSIYKCRFAGKEYFTKDYCSIDETRSINGIFILLILISHTYAKGSTIGVLDEIYEPIRTFLGQFVVVPFMFFSGYGIMESIKKKETYIKTFPRRRVLPLYIRFAVISLIYVPISLIMSPGISVTRYLLSFTGLTSIGNGGWYIFAIFMMYLFVIVAFNIFKNRHFLAVCSVLAMTVVLTVVEVLLDFPTYYYSTMLFFPIGMLFSLYKEYFDKFVTRSNAYWAICMIISIAGFAMVKVFLVDKSVVFYPVWCIFGMATILLLGLKVKLNNKIINWAGKNIFMIFMLQGIPQILLIKLAEINNILYYVAVIIATVLLTLLAEIIQKKIEAIKTKNVVDK